jgi:hypothetical protein
MCGTASAYWTEQQALLATYTHTGTQQLQLQLL